ncbi:MAG TPA: hypothetical protein DGG94_15070, partial [Micromonosporaceae bacterium]|nr:hypothetical protein [Micromonosporaceae bacterium]
MASTLNWAARGITIRQDTTFPEAASSRLTITGSSTFTLRLRTPVWSSGMQVRVNGTLQNSPVITRAWASGDVVDISLPMALHRESTPDSASVQAVKVGPIVLAG